MKKLTSYQKLKLENEKLKQDIFNLVRKENDIDGILTKQRYSNIYDTNDAIMFGSRTAESNSNFTGIMAVVSKNN